MVAAVANHKLKPNMKGICYFDIETGPLSTAVLQRRLAAIRAPANYKDPLKIAEYIREEHEAMLDKAALSPLTGRVLALALLKPAMQAGDSLEIVSCEDESCILSRFWELCELAANNSKFRLCGFNIHEFDIPFLVKRSWALGVRVPHQLTGDGWSRYHFTWWLIDLRKIWGISDYRPEGSLNDICIHLGIGEKKGSGKDFAKLWASDRKAAIAYCTDEIYKIEQVAQRLGVS
jgi:hypothetical protein